MAQELFDVVIVGGGPAGRAAALVLARACRKVLVLDRGTPRSWASHALYAFPSRDGVHPREFRRIAREELAQYPHVRWRDEEVTGARRLPAGGFEVATRRRVARCRKLLIATGVMDDLPPIPDIERYYGRSVFQCPYCDGYELRDAPLGAWGQGRRGPEIARALTAWSRDIVLFTHGPADFPARERRALERNRIEIVETPVAGLSGRGGRLTAVRLADGRRVRRRALFFDTVSRPQSALAKSLGCQFDDDGAIRCGKYEASSVPGVFIAGNILRDVQLSVVAAAEGARAAFGINRSLTREDFRLRATGVRTLEHPGPR